MRFRECEVRKGKVGGVFPRASSVELATKMEFNSSALAEAEETTSSPEESGGIEGLLELARLRYRFQNCFEFKAWLSVFF